MQALMRMRFGPYTFLQNPAQLQVENRGLQQEERLLSGGVCVTPAGRRATVITGKGWWDGGRALEMAQVLRRLLLPGQESPLPKRWSGRPLSRRAEMSW